MNIVNKACNLNNFRSSKAMEHCMTIQIIDKGWYDYCKIGNILSLENKITTGINLFFYIFQTRTVPLEPQIGYDFENSINHIKFRNFQPFIIMVQIFFQSKPHFEDLPLPNTEFHCNVNKDCHTLLEHKAKTGNW